MQVALCFNVVADSKGDELCKDIVYSYCWRWRAYSVVLLLITITTTNSSQSIRRLQGVSFLTTKPIPGVARKIAMPAIVH